MRARNASAAAALIALIAGIVYAGDQTIKGSQLLVKNPNLPQNRKITGKAKETGSPNTIVGDPIANGAMLTITASGTTTTMQTFGLLPGTSFTTNKPFWSGDATKGFRYRDPKGENSAVKTLQIRKTASGVFTLKVVASGRINVVNVQPPDTGSGGCLLLAIVGGDSYSVNFASATFTNKGAVLFKAKNPTAEGTCVTTTTTTTTSTTTTTTTTTSTTTTSTTTTSSTTTTTLYGSPSRAFVDRVTGLLD
jgi:hypothetical protein